MKAIIPIAGLGTRLLPFTKVIPKAMLPVANKPCVQWIAEELSEAGIKEIIFVYSRGQEMVQDYFARKTWYEEELEKRGNKETRILEDIRNLAKFYFVEQKEQLGDGHAILQAKELIEPDETFLVIFGDCLYTGDNVLKKLQEAYNKTQKCIVAVQEIPHEEAHNYGIVITDSAGKIQTMIEKPTPKDPNDPKDSKDLKDITNAIIGRYLLTPQIWSHLHKQPSGSGEIRLIDALKELQTEEDIYAVEMKGTWLDTGTLEGIQRAAERLKNRTNLRSLSE